MSLDIHPEHASLIAAGFYDGTVAVYDLQEKSTLPKFRSTAKTGKHTDPVWQVAIHGGLAITWLIVLT